MDFRQLQYFLCVVDEKSFTKASNKLLVSQPALSKMIKLLEIDVGAQLLHRTNKQFKLTEIGEEIYIEGKKIIASFEELNNYASTITDSNIGNIVVGLPPVLGTCLIPSFLDRFFESYPKIKVGFREVGANTVQNMILTEEIDVGLAILPVDSQKFNIVPIVDGVIVAVLHTEHKLSHKKNISIRELQDDDLLLLNDSYTLHHNIMNVCENYGFKPKLKMVCQNWDLLLQMTRLKQGVTILPEPIVTKFKCENIISVELNDELLKWKIVAITKKNKLTSNAVRKFINCMKQNAEL